MEKHPYKPNYSVTAGEIIAEHLEALKIKKKALADACGLSAKHISMIINGHAPLTSEVALRMEPIIKLDALILMRIEVENQIFVLRKKAA